MKMTNSLLFKTYLEFIIIELDMSQNTLKFITIDNILSYEFLKFVLHNKKRISKFCK